MMFIKRLLVFVVLSALCAVSLSGQAHAVAIDPGAGGTSTPVASPPPPPPQPGYTIDISGFPNKSTNGTNKIQALLNIVFSVIGGVALLIITLAGFRYINSNGDPQKASQAKSTIIYALVGLVVSIAGISIVTFVLGKT